MKYRLEKCHTLKSELRHRNEPEKYSNRTAPRFGHLAWLNGYVDVDPVDVPDE
jgi:hypothetical protein